MPWSLAITVGTTDSVDAMAENGRIEAVEIDHRRVMLSSVFRTPEGNLVVGDAADSQAVFDPSSYEPNPKRRMGSPEMVLGGVAVPTAQVVGAVLATIATEAISRHGARPPDQVVLTHPVAWAGPRLEALRAAAAAAGLGPGGTAIAPGAEVTLVAEPVAAGTCVAQALEPGAHLAVYDLGGGTFDVAVLQRSVDGFTVVSRGGIDPLGGEDFDHHLLDYIGRTWVAPEHPEAWEQLCDPTDTTWRLKARDLRQWVRRAKELLSGVNDYTNVFIPGPDTSVLVGKNEFEGLIRADLERSVEELAATVERAGLRPGDLSGLYLVGGSSRIPLVADRVWAHLGLRPAAFDGEAKEVVSRGAAMGVAVPARTVRGPDPEPMPDRSISWAANVERLLRMRSIDQLVGVDEMARLGLERLAALRSIEGPNHQQWCDLLDAHRDLRLGDVVHLSYIGFDGLPGAQTAAAFYFRDQAATMLSFLRSGPLRDDPSEPILGLLPPCCPVHLHESRMMHKLLGKGVGLLAWSVVVTKRRLLMIGWSSTALREMAKPQIASTLTPEWFEVAGSYLTSDFALEEWSGTNFHFNISHPEEPPRPTGISGTAPLSSITLRMVLRRRSDRQAFRIDVPMVHLQCGTAVAVVVHGQ